MTPTPDLIERLERLERIASRLERYAFNRFTTADDSISDTGIDGRSVDDGIAFYERAVRVREIMANLLPPPPSSKEAKEALG